MPPAATQDPRDRRDRVQLPLLDRLMAANLEGPDAGALSARDALERLREAVLRDVQALLSARRRRWPLPPHLRELDSSLLGYGLPDATSGSFQIPHVRAALASEVEAVLRRHEPRLEKVVVTLVSDDAALNATVKLRIEAVLRAEPVPEAVSFETLLEPVTRDVDVREAVPR
jgi:type VI secretion system protein ImpF